MLNACVLIVAYALPYQEDPCGIFMWLISCILFPVFIGSALLKEWMSFQEQKAALLELHIIFLLQENALTI